MTISQQARRGLLHQQILSKLPKKRKLEVFVFISDRCTTNPCDGEPPRMCGLCSQDKTSRVHLPVDGDSGARPYVGRSVVSGMTLWPRREGAGRKHCSSQKCIAVYRPISYKVKLYNTTLCIVES